ncbi:hypothetical protein PIIN_09639 [Serendipita indica DSM 11827]|uniref:NAD-dependent epimerase/dehydratase domain-containing protein n=1 Tax=Serendipita indica (strain DSM 11827) TaxID=1109443 RepID=G4TWF6_SERID|nr:hypothetical protein PIIN_09639 [Serendipita indica DSM 11827]
MESVDGFLYSFAHLMGLSHSDVSYRAPANPLEGAMSVTTKLRPTLARSLLGWEPRKASLTDGMAAYFEAWKAINASKSK